MVDRDHMLWHFRMDNKQYVVNTLSVHRVILTPSLTSNTGAHVYETTPRATDSCAMGWSREAMLSLFFKKERKGEKRKEM